MPQGLQCFDENGAITFDTDVRLPRIVASIIITTDTAIAVQLPSGCDVFITWAVNGNAAFGGYWMPYIDGNVIRTTFVSGVSPTQQILLTYGVY